MSDDRRQGSFYRVSDDEKRLFAREGYVHLRGVLSDEEVGELETVYDRFLRREIEVPGKDYCDMSGEYGREPADFAIVNVMLPRRYWPAWQGNVYERRAASIAQQLCGDGMAIDYDQLLAKRPHEAKAVFGWHQDMAYWIDTADRRTATCWLAIDPSTRENGCMRFVPGSHLEAQLRPHRPLHGDRETSHTLVTEVDPQRDDVRLAEIARGDITVHNERVLHGSGGNDSDGWRRAYIVAFRSEATIAEERRRGFTHSHNDETQVKDAVGIAGETKHSTCAARAANRRVGREFGRVVPLPQS
ncbi:MAG: phytanoyl-CoA dioxygenase family protein [Planctomycetota bacterium]